MRNKTTPHFLHHQPPNMAAEEEEEDELQLQPSLKFPFLASAAVLSPEHPSGTASPPLHALASVPFKWEEQPGKPRPCTDIILRPEPVKCLEPPPCSKVPKMPSPTTVLDGPYNLGRSKFSSFRMFREKQRSFDSSSSGGGGSPQSSVEVAAGRKNGGRLKMFARSFRKKDGDERGSFGFSPSSSSSFAGLDEGVFAEGKMRRNGSFSSFTQTASTPIWVSMYKSVKHAIPWKLARKKKNEGRHY